MNSKLISYGKITSFVQYKTKNMQKKMYWGDRSEM